MTTDDFINHAIEYGQANGLNSLDEIQRLVFLISQVEVECDINGIDTFLDCNSSDQVLETARAFAEVGALRIAALLQRIAEALPARVEEALSEADHLIKVRAGYDFEAIRAMVARRLSSTLRMKKT